MVFSKQTPILFWFVGLGFYFGLGFVGGVCVPDSYEVSARGYYGVLAYYGGSLGAVVGEDGFVLELVVLDGY